jgi:predicted ATP-grasp superfamily ATP-dependent carboligase
MNKLGPVWPIDAKINPGPCLIIGDHTQGLGITRCLGIGRYQPVVIWDRAVSLSRFSRYLHAYRRVRRGTMQEINTSPASGHLLAAIEALVPAGGRWPVFTVHEDLVYFLYRYRKRLQGRLLVPDNDIPAIIDKYRFAERMNALKIDTPDTHLLSSFPENRLDGSGEFVAKGRLGIRFRNISNCKGRMIRSAEDLAILMDYISDEFPHDEVIIQEKIITNEKVLSCCGLAIKGRILRSFQYVKLRQHPDQFGTGTYLESIRHPDLLALADRITMYFAYTGIFEIEFIETVDGRMMVIEMNPRTWKSIHFAALCGQNLCRLYCDYLTTGRIPQENHTYQTGRRWVDIITDLHQVSRQKGITAVRYPKGTLHCVADRKDPLPFAVELLLAPLLVLGI